MEDIIEEIHNMARKEAKALFKLCKAIGEESGKDFDVKGVVDVYADFLTEHLRGVAYGCN